jgi:hypothetical protein
MKYEFSDRPSRVWREVEERCFACGKTANLKKEGSLYYCNELCKSTIHIITKEEEQEELDRRYNEIANTFAIKRFNRGRQMDTERTSLVRA